MFDHAYSSYMKHAFPNDELAPLSCSHVRSNPYGNLSLTFIDSMDSLAMFNTKNGTEFCKAVQWTSANLVFDKDANVSVFETNIRIIGGLLSSHLLMIDPKLSFKSICKSIGYNGELLDKAKDLADRLLPAFFTPTGLPYGTVNLMHGISQDESTIVSTASAGSFIVEFGTLSRLTGIIDYEVVAKRAIRSLFNRKSPTTGLVGAHIDVLSGQWTEVSCRIGSHVDSFFESLLKGYILFDDTELLYMFQMLYDALQRSLWVEGRWVEANIFHGTYYHNVMHIDSLSAFFPGLQVLFGDVLSAEMYMVILSDVIDAFGILPESAFMNSMREWEMDRPHYFLRPEYMESLWYFDLLGSSDQFRLKADNYMSWIEEHSKVSCGYANVMNISDFSLEDKMESFLLSETLKYALLIFEKDHFVNTGNYVLNTEAHPFSVSLIRSLEIFPNLSDGKEDVLTVTFHTENASSPELIHSYSISEKSFDLLYQLHETNFKPFALSSIPLHQLAQVISQNFRNPFMQTPQTILINIQSSHHCIPPSIKRFYPN